MQIEFHGANKNVTGSCHLVRCNGTQLLVDCGMHQGGADFEEENRDDFGFDPAAIDYLLLTHAHLDHCGRIPLLVKRGFKGKIVSTPATRELARLVMLDSAKLQEDDAEYRMKKAGRRGNRVEVPEPLYNILDALNSMDYFTDNTGYGKRLPLADGISVTLYDAGHILGSASIHLQCAEADTQRSMVFSGDLGNAGRPLLRDPTPPPAVDIVVMETTYGDRLHKPLAPSIEELYQAIEDTLRRGGNIIIPTFALERTQEILFHLHSGVESGRLPHSMQVFLDSPMAISATEIFRHHPECLDEEANALLASGKHPFSLFSLHYTRETAESMALNRITGGAVILAGSGMATGGRVRHHLKHNLWRENSSVIFVGFAAQGTLARRIVDGAQSVRLFGEEIPVRAHIYTINGFSAHADRDELLAWHRHSHAPRTFLVHGEESVMQQFAGKLENTQVEMPAFGQTYDL